MFNQRIYEPLAIFHKIMMLFFFSSKGIDSSADSQKDQYSNLRNTNIVTASVLFCLNFLIYGKYALPNANTPMQCNQVKLGYLFLKEFSDPLCQLQNSLFAEALGSAIECTDSDKIEHTWKRLSFLYIC